jgi:hypothetical protein
MCLVCWLVTGKILIWYFGCLNLNIWMQRPYLVKGGFQAWARNLRVKELKPETALIVLNEVKESEPETLLLISVPVSIVLLK